MRKEIEMRLVKEFPKLYRDYGGDPKKTCMAWGFATGDGWFELIYGLSMSLKELSPNARALQVKEKLGTLRFYVEGLGKDRGRIQELIHRAEDASAKICEECGKPGKRKTKAGWISTLCKKCEGKRKALR